MARDRQVPTIELLPDGPNRWRIEPFGPMHVPGIVYASESLLPDIKRDRALEQVCNVATLPGIAGASYAMPDIHWGYGFPIGGVAATDISAGGVVSPGGVGFDISCGVRLLLSNLDEAGFQQHRRPLMNRLARSIHRGMGPGGTWHLADRSELIQVLRHGVRYAVSCGFGTDDDVARCEKVDPALVPDDPSLDITERALERGFRQIGSLGSGNHFLEVQVVDRVIDAGTAEHFGLHAGQVVVMIHSGSRGLGHQVCTDHVAAMDGAMSRYGIAVPDRQLACVPVDSPEGASYIRAMTCAANYGRVNRQVLGHAARLAFAETVAASTLRLLFDVSHNLAHLEDHVVESRSIRMCVHRKGATRALPPGHPHLPDALRDVGQPVLVPGSMGTASWVLVGVEGSGAYHSACHGAGRTMSRHQARRLVQGRRLERELEGQGISVRGTSARGLAEEAPVAYKDVDEVVAVCESAGLARTVARLRPVGVIKG